MSGDPVSKFSPLLKVCINEERSQSVPSMILSTALSFALGLVGSGLSAYLLSLLTR